MQNTAVKKRALWEKVDSDYLCGNSFAVFAFSPRVEAQVTSQQATN
jgi:hypothetical protein